MKREVFSKIAFVFLFLLGTGGGFVSSGETSNITIDSLFANEQVYNNKTVIVQGEVLEALPQKTGEWINIRGKNSGIGIWCGKNISLPEIKHFTGFHQKGDIIKARGVFHSSCPDHWGESDIHAFSVQFVRQGFSIEEAVSLKKKKLVFLWACLFAAALIFYIAEKLIKKSRHQPREIE